MDFDYFRKNATSTLTSSDQFLTVPNDYLASFFANYNFWIRKFSFTKRCEFFKRVYTKASTTGLPKYYARFDENNFILAPTPNSAYTIELHYFYRPASLTAGADGGTTWLSTNAPYALLYGSLVEAYSFMKGEPDVLQNYNGLYIAIS